ncbi:unnamed protein product, partial [Prorocentrum cordatum]
MDQIQDTLSPEAGAFRAGCLELRKDASSRSMLDETLVEYLGCLYSDGYNHERGDSLLAGLAFEELWFRRGGARDPARALAALLGLRRLAPGQARTARPRAKLAALLGAGSGVQNWALLLHTATADGRSKADREDVGLLLDGFFTKGIDSQLGPLKKAAGHAASLRPCTAAEFREGFSRAAAAIGRPAPQPYQVRQGAVDDDALYQKR